MIRMGTGHAGSCANSPGYSATAIPVMVPECRGETANETAEASALIPSRRSRPLPSPKNLPRDDKLLDRRRSRQNLTVHTAGFKSGAVRVKYMVWAEQRQFSVQFFYLLRRQWMIEYRGIGAISHNWQGSMFAMCSPSLVEQLFGCKIEPDCHSRCSRRPTSYVYLRRLTIAISSSN